MAQKGFTQNRIEIAGKLVEKVLEVKAFEGKNGNPDYNAMTGSLKLRTSNGSEFKVEVFAKEGTGIFEGLETCQREYKSVAELIQQGATQEQAIAMADVISTSPKFNTGKPYKNGQGEAVTSTKISGSFFNRVAPDKIEATPLVAKFNVTGTISEIKDVLKDNAPTGDKWVMVDVVEKYTKKDKPENPVYTLHSVRCFLGKEKVGMFMGAGFNVGRACNLAGEMVNIETKVEKVIARDFGDPEVKVFTTTERKNVITGGSTAKTQDDICYTEAVLSDLRAKRELEKRQIVDPNTGSNPFGGVDTGVTQDNPFVGGAGATNPFL